MYGQYSTGRFPSSTALFPVSPFSFLNLLPDFATFFILTSKKTLKNTALGLYFFAFCDIIIYRVIGT